MLPFNLLTIVFLYCSFLSLIPYLAFRVSRFRVFTELFLESLVDVTFKVTIKAVIWKTSSWFVSDPLLHDQEINYLDCLDRSDSARWAFQWISFKAPLPLLASSLALSLRMPVAPGFIMEQKQSDITSHLLLEVVLLSIVAYSDVKSLLQENVHYITVRNSYFPTSPQPGQYVPSVSNAQLYLSYKAYSGSCQLTHSPYKIQL